MALVIVGGHTRNIGKTSVVAGLIRAMPEMRWTAFKITQYGHGVCSANGKPCDCETADHSAAITEERDGESGTDSGRFLAAGAVRSLWVRTRQGQLAEAMPRVRREIASAKNAIVESNSILRFVVPDVFISVLDPSVKDFKDSAKRYLDRADALVVPSNTHGAPAWDEMSSKLLLGAREFYSNPPEYCSPALAAFVLRSLKSKAPRQTA